jgi:hypothetical protein
MRFNLRLSLLLLSRATSLARSLRHHTHLFSAIDEEYQAFEYCSTATPLQKTFASYDV